MCFDQSGRSPLTAKSIGTAAVPFEEVEPKGFGAPRTRLLVISEPGIAGVKRHVCHLLANVDLAEFDVTFIYSLVRADETFAEEIEGFRRRGIRCIQIPMMRNIAPMADIAALRKIRRVILEVKPAIIHCHSAKAGFLGRLASVLSGTGSVTVYTPNAMPCYLSKKYLLLERLAGTWTNWIIAVSESEKQDVLSWKIVSESRLRVIPMAVELPEVSCPLRPHDNEAIVIGACGRICVQKRAAFFFQVGEELLRRNERVRLVWIGDFSDDSESQAVRDLMRASPLKNRMEVTGWVKNATAEISKLDVFCMFSRYESFGLVTAEAMLLGVPVVALDGSGTRDLIVHRHTGMICDGTIEGSVAAIEELLSSPQTRRALTQQAKQHVKSKHSSSVANSSLHKFYREIAGRRTSQDNHLLAIER